MVSRDFLDDPVWLEHGAGAPLLDFQRLMRHRVSEVLLVSSLYDLYLFEEEGRLYELIRDEYLGLHQSHAPELTRVSRGSEALELLRGKHRFDLVITTPHVEDMTALRLARTLRESGVEVPVVLLAYDNRELADMLTHGDVSVFDRIFVWQGDFRLLIAIIKDLEDRINVEHDTREFGVQCILVVEDDVRQYSWFLPLLYTETLKHSKRLITEGVNLSQRSLRMRGRPKILLCLDWEEAWERFEAYRESILGVISDVAFPRGGEQDARAGIELARKIRGQVFDIPIILQSAGGDFSEAAEEMGATFISKSSPSMLADFRRCLTEYFSFGDFIFRTPDGAEVGRASDLASLERQLQKVPDESILYHSERNHFSNWLKARTEFRLAAQLRPRRVSDYHSPAELRADLLLHLRENRRLRQQGLLSDFSRETFEPNVSFARIGGGSVGGKARGLAFVNMLLHGSGVRESQAAVEIEVPAGIVLGTEVFDAFLGMNRLREFALACEDDDEIAGRFLDADQFPKDAAGKLAAFLGLCREPLAVRSSSLLEDSQYHPFAGVYLTCMIPNRGADAGRLEELLATIKRVYASTFFRAARDYMKVTSFSIADEKMAVIVHRMVGAEHGERFYPDISGVTRSYNFYPIPPQTPNDGITSVALGLGRLIVEGGVAARFCPKYPTHLIQLASPAVALKNSQTFFYALDKRAKPLELRSAAGDCVAAFRLEDAERDGTLAAVASTWSHENDALYDGVGRPGTRVVTFAPILRGKTFPLPEICELLSRLSSWGMGTPVEIEFAVTLSVAQGEKPRFFVLQVRPLVLSQEIEELTIGEVGGGDLVCQSRHVLGHGVIRGIRDIVVVDPRRYERSTSREVARELARLNARLIAEGRGYLLVGPGRWGSADPWLGIPVKWDQISGAKAIIEAEPRDIAVDPSQGSHFFQNITAFMVGYFTVAPRGGEDESVDWEWLAEQPAVEERGAVRHLRLAEPLLVKINGHQNRGVILKPGVER